MAYSPAPRSGQRRWRVTPALRNGGGGLAGLDILNEVPGELGGMLWQSLRAVSLWAAVPGPERAALFTPGAQERRLADLLALGTDPALDEPLMTLAHLLGKSSGPRPEQVGLACSRVAAWAQTYGAPATALEFALAAALVCPGDARLALAAARAHRDRGEYPPAESWYQRAVALARQSGDWDCYTRGYIGQGNMWIARGVYPAARKSLLRAQRAAERRSLHELRGMALHDLFTVASDCSRDEEAHQYAEAALHAYGAGHRLLPVLAIDVAYFWMGKGQFAEALPVLRAAIPHADPRHVLLWQGNLARAAGVTGDANTYRAASAAVWAAADDAPGKADALVETARGAIGMGHWSAAERAARRALTIAEARGESKIVFVAEAVLQIAQRRLVTEPAGSSAAVGAEPLVSYDGAATALAGRLAASLYAGAGS